MIKSLLQKVADAQDLTFEEMETAMEYIMNGQASEAQIGAFLTGLRLKGETVQEIAGAAATMRKKAVRISPHPLNGNALLDTCGTGGTAAGHSTSRRLRPLWRPAPAPAWQSTATGGYRADREAQTSWRPSAWTSRSSRRRSSNASTKSASGSCLRQGCMPP